MIILRGKQRRKRIAKYKIHWYRGFPYVIAEVINTEWKGLQKLMKEKGHALPMIKRMYNSNGNWYLLESLSYFFLGRTLFKNKNEFLFNDSLHFNFDGKSDEEKYKMLIGYAKNDIDVFWSEFYSIPDKIGKKIFNFFKK